jgi:acyl carrier protein
MTEAETYAELTSVFREVFDDDGLMLHPDTTADDIPGWDSQANITLVAAAEQHFGVRVSDRGNREPSQRGGIHPAHPIEAAEFEPAVT